MTSSNYPTVQYFLLKLRTSFLLTNVYKRYVRFFFISFRSWVISKNLKRPGVCTLVFYTFINNSRSKQNKKNPTHHFVDITNYKTCAKFQQNKLNSVVVGARQRFRFLDKKPGFLEIREVCLSLGIGFCITWLVLPNYKSISS